ncbi:hypothetical protein PN471_10225, partial [Aphanizomenon sp. CS-733/32]|uniref:hypothetical protein n=1 Tax=Aphanizomenon sp. CS-733/32 TaxID=3021715 RepID=UPI00232D8A36
QTINHRIPHPVNPEILEILIQTINHRIPHPVNPEILEILIQTIDHSDEYLILRVVLFYQIAT